jgi:hypothetical protein
MKLTFGTRLEVMSNDFNPVASTCVLDVPVKIFESLGFHRVEFWGEKVGSGHVVILQKRSSFWWKAKCGVDVNGH